MKERFVELPLVIPALPPIPELNAVPPKESTPSTSSGPSAKSKTKVVKPTPPPTEFIPTLRYVDKATGKIYETFADEISESQFTTTVIPKVYDAYFSGKGNTVLMRYLNDDGQTIETFIGSLPKEILGEDSTSDTEIKGSFLPENISNISISRDTTKLFYLFNLGNNDSSIGITAAAAGDKKIQVFSSPFTEWLSDWSNNKMITLTTKPSAGIPGYMYSIDPDKKNLNKILGDINGLTTLLSPNGKLVLYSSNNLSLNVYNIDTKQSSETGITTLPEKCVWNKNSDAVYCATPIFIEKTGYPDVWYQGAVSFNDQIWKINIADNSTELISDLTSGGEDIDGIKLALDEGENYLFFVNKKNSYLWELRLK